MSARPITDTLRRIGRGKFIDKSSLALAELVRHVEESGQAGTLVLAIRVSKAARGGALVIEGKHDLKLPKATPEDALMWATPDGDLVDHDPNQGQLGLEVVDSSRSQQRAG